MTYRILVVEDDDELSTLLRLMLKLSDWEIRSAGDAHEALERAHEFQPSLALLDVMLPGGVDGVELCRRLRAEPYMAGVPIVMLSAKSDPKTQRAALQAGAVEYWVKPVTPQEFLGNIKRVLGI